MMQHFQMPMSHVLPRLGNKFALYFDLDGVLARIAAVPQEAYIPEAVLRALYMIDMEMEGAMAIVSGRQITEVDKICAPHQFVMAGQHGLELRLPGGEIQRAWHEQAKLEKIKSEIMAFHDNFPQLLLEFKGLSVAIHYRRVPEMETAVIEFASELVLRNPDYKLQNGKMVCEVRLAGTDKGQAIRQLQQHAPFTGRKPVFIGDDATDEDGFAAVNDMGGISVKIGDGATLAKHRISNIETFHHWLKLSALLLTVQRERRG